MAVDSILKASRERVDAEAVHPFPIGTSVAPLVVSLADSLESAAHVRTVVTSGTAFGLGTTAEAVGNNDRLLSLPANERLSHVGQRR
jgi:hypothetical protein